LFSYRAPIRIKLEKEVVQAQLPADCRQHDCAPVPVEKKAR
jgi:hypothetical protein